MFERLIPAEARNVHIRRNVLQLFIQNFEPNIFGKILIELERKAESG